MCVSGVPGGRDLRQGAVPGGTGALQPGGAVRLRRRGGTHREPGPPGRAVRVRLARRGEQPGVRTRYH